VTKDWIKHSMLTIMGAGVVRNSCLMSAEEAEHSRHSKHAAINRVHDMSGSDAITVGSVMGEPPIAVDRLVTVARAIELMRQHQIGSLVIDKQHEDDEYGLLVIADIAKKVISANRSLERTNVYEIMSKPVISVDIDMTLKYAIRVLDRFGVSRALVTERGNLVGMVTTRSMVIGLIGPAEG
jgi:predicted transcriptional regulator